MNIKGLSFIKPIILVGIMAIIVYVFINNLSDIKNNGPVLAVGDDAPDFQLTTLDGNLVKLNDYRGQGVFLNFWATYCPPCKKEMPYMQNQYKLFKEKGVVVLAVDVAEPQWVVKKFTEDYGITFPVLLDLKKETVDDYGVAAIPVTFLIDEHGKVVDRVPAGLTETQITGYMEQIIPKDKIDSESVF